MSEQPGMKSILFVCDNSCRSQMAEGFLRERAGRRFEVASAGASPTRLDPLTVRVMAEIGVDITEQYSKSVGDMTGERFDYVISFCDKGREACPSLSGESRLHWSVDDPAQATGDEEQRLKEFRRIRDEISSNINDFLSAHDPANGSFETKRFATM